VVPQEQGEAIFVDSTSGEFEDSLRGFGFRGGEVQAVAFEENVAGHKTGSLVPIDERMVSHYSRDVSGSQLEQVAFGVGEDLARPGQSRFKQPGIAQAWRAAVFGEKGWM
jgi:hypothetical protein